MNNKCLCNERSGIQNAFDPVTSRLSVVTAKSAFGGLTSANVIISWHRVRAQAKRKAQMRVSEVLVVREDLFVDVIFDRLRITNFRMF